MDAYPDPHPTDKSPAPSPGGMPPAGLADHPDYQILRELGRGGIGVVYLARNTLMGRHEVLKLIGGRQANRGGIFDRLLAEIRNAGKLHHPNIVTVYSAFRSGEDLVLAMEHVEGLDLARLVGAKGPLPVANACGYVHQVASGLQHAHEQGMVHHNIKPGNLILTRQGNKAVVKIADFGLTRAGQVLGTPDFMAPEQTTDPGRVDIRADIYSLGCTFYDLLTGNPPFQGANLYDVLQAHQSMEAMPLNLARPDVPTALAVIVATMMAKEPGRRFQTPGEVSRALAPFIKKESPSPRGSAPQTAGADAASGFQLSQGAGWSAAPEPLAIPGAPAPVPSKSTGPGWDTLIEIPQGNELAAEVRTLREARGSRGWLWPASAGVIVLLGIAVNLGINFQAPKTQSPGVPAAAPAAPLATVKVPPTPASKPSEPRPGRTESPSPPRPAPGVDPAPPLTEALVAHNETPKPPDRPDRNRPAAPDPPPKDQPEEPIRAEKPAGGEPKPKPEAELTPEQNLEQRGLTKVGRYFVVDTEREYGRVWNSTVKPAINLMEVAWGAWNDALEVQAVYLNLGDQRDNLIATIDNLRLQMNGANRQQQLALQNLVRQAEFELNTVRANLSQVQKRLASPAKMRELENTFSKQRQGFLAAKDELQPVFNKMISEYNQLGQDEKVKIWLGVLGERFKVKFSLGPSETIQGSVKTLRRYLEMVSANPDTARGKRRRKTLEERPKGSMSKGS